MRRDYGPDVLAAGAGRRRRAEFPQVPADRGLVVEEAGGGFCGAVVDCEKHVVTLEDRRGKQRVFPLTRGGFLLEGSRVTLVRPRRGGPAGAGGTGRTASGSLAAPRPAGSAARRARVARASRIYVEGRHDADLVEKIWGDDLRELGVVVEYLAGIDHLPPIVAGFAPGPARRLGVLVDHLVTGSKESRIAAQVSSPYVLVVGHPFVDILAGGQASQPRHRRLARRPAGNALEGGGAAGPGVGRRHRRRMAEDSRRREQLYRPGAGAAGPGRGTDRLRHHARNQRSADGCRGEGSPKPSGHGPRRRPVAGPGA